MSNSGINNHFDKQLEAVGNTVVLRKQEIYHERTDGDLFISEDADINCRTNTAIVESVGDLVDKTIKEGDTVLYDFFGVYADTHPVVCADARNIIGIFSSTETDRNVIIPVGTRLLLSPVGDRGRMDDGLYIPEDVLTEESKTTEEAIVVGYGGGCTDMFKLGDTLLVAQKDIMRLSLKGEKFLVVQEEAIIAVVARHQNI